MFQGFLNRQIMCDIEKIPFIENYDCADNFWQVVQRSLELLYSLAPFFVFILRHFYDKY